MRVKFFIILFFSQLLSSFAIARLPKNVPLLPPREASGAPVSLKNRTYIDKSQKSDPISLGFELGTLLRNDSTSGDLLGMQLFWGGRISAEFALMGSSFHIKPSIGYFRKQQSEGAVSVTQHVVEGGANFLYQVTQFSGVEWSVGAVGRLDYLVSNIRLYDQSEFGSSFRFRAGPSSGLKFKVSKEFKLTTDFELSFAVSRPTRVFGGLTTGLVFEL